MMRWVILSFSMIFLMIVGILAVHVQDFSEDSKSQKTRVAVIMMGVRNDHNWNESHYDALEKVADHLNLEMAYYDNVPTDSMAKGIMEMAIEDGARIVICNSFGFGSVELAVAKKHPEVKFFHATGVQTAPNLLTYFGRIYQMRYLSGIVAGMKTKKNRIGYVASFNLSEVNRGINAFTLGVQRVNPDAKVYVSWSNSWIDESMASDATRELLDKYDVDVMTVHVDAYSPYEIADKNNVWIIGYNRDNSDRFPRHFLTAPVWHWDAFYEPQIRNVLRGRFEGKSYWLGDESGLVDLAPFTGNVSSETKYLVEQERKRLSDGFFDVFQGPIVDNHGVLRVEKGERMTDEDLLNHFDWYVQGVVDGIKPEE